MSSAMLPNMLRPVALLLPLALFFTACPGSEQSFDLPKPDADDVIPDATINPEALAPQPVKVMNWNVRNFYNDKRDSLEIDVANETIESTENYQAKLSAVAAEISGINPDIVILVEVENQAVLDDLGSKLGNYPNRAITQGNDPRGIDIAVLSKLQFQIGPSHKNDLFSPSTDATKTFKYARDVLQVDMRVNQRHFGLFGVHFKAKDSEPDSDLKRLAEAEHTYKIVSGVHNADQSAALMVLGDFNDGPGSPPLDALAGIAPYNLTSATLGLAPADRFSYTFSGNQELMDDQLDDPNASKLLDPTGVSIDHSVDAALSDHDPVIATYLVK